MPDEEYTVDQMIAYAEGSSLTSDWELQIGTPIDTAVGDLMTRHMGDWQQLGEMAQRYRNAPVNWSTNLLNLLMWAWLVGYRTARSNVPEGTP